MSTARGPFRFMLDTGAVDVAAQSLTARLGLKLGADVSVRGTGNGSTESAIVVVPSVDVGGAVLTGENFYVLSLDPIEQLAGVHVDGILGFEFFRRYVTRFDFAARTITLTDPADFKPDGAGTAIAMTFAHNTPEVAGTYDGIPGTFDIDTGDNGGLTPHHALRGGASSARPAPANSSTWSPASASAARPMRGSCAAASSSSEP